MCTRAECSGYVGKYIRFRSPYGYHEGIVERVAGNQAIILSPRRYIPVNLAAESLDADEVRRLDLALAWGGYPRGGYPGGGYPGGPGPGRYGGAYGFGGFGGFGWARWAVSFLAIYLLFGLLW